MKLCSRCAKTKNIEDFPINKSGRGGRNSTCKECKVENNQLRQFGITTSDALRITNVCHVCEKDLNLTGRVCIDHDHNTGKVRGILCMSCNSGIGKLGDNKEGLERALRYISNPPLFS